MGYEQLPKIVTERVRNSDEKNMKFGICPGRAEKFTAEMLKT